VELRVDDFGLLRGGGRAENEGESDSEVFHESFLLTVMGRLGGGYLLRISTM
jgi:hypothetical protein